MAVLGRQIFGADLKALRERLGLSTRDFSIVMGIGVLQFHKMTSEEGRKKPITDPSLAMVIRWYNDHPEDVPRQTAPTFKEVLEVVQGTGLEITPQQVVTILGRNFTNLYRYQSVKKEKSPKNINGVASTAFRVLHGIAQKYGAKGIEKWREYANLEARVRGADYDIAPLSGLSTRTWPSPLNNPLNATKPKEPKVKRAKTKAIAKK